MITTADASPWLRRLRPGRHPGPAPGSVPGVAVVIDCQTMDLLGGVRGRRYQNRGNWATNRGGLADGKWVVTGTFTEPGGDEAACELFSRHPRRRDLTSAPAAESPLVAAQERGMRDVVVADLRTDVTPFSVGPVTAAPSCRRNRLDSPRPLPVGRVGAHT
jgi:hypothetical protein